MKKLIAILIAISMMFSFTPVSFAGTVTQSFLENITVVKITKLDGSPIEADEGRLNYVRLPEQGFNFTTTSGCTGAGSSDIGMWQIVLPQPHIMYSILTLSKYKVVEPDGTTTLNLSGSRRLQNLITNVDTELYNNQGDICQQVTGFSIERVGPKEAADIYSGGDIRAFNNKIHEFRQLFRFPIE